MNCVRRLKYAVIGLFLIVVLLFVFEKPLLYSYYNFNSVKVEIKYKNSLLLNSSDIESNDESEYVQYEYISDETVVKLPHKLDTITIKSKTEKVSVYQLQTCFYRDNNYCFIFSDVLRHFSYNDKTHRGDMLVVLDSNGNEKCRYMSTEKEWILDYKNNVVLIYNLKENSLYCKDINSGILCKKTIIECDKYEKVVFDYEKSIWQASFFSDGDVIYKKAAPTIDYS